MPCDHRWKMNQFAYQHSIFKDRQQNEACSTIYKVVSYKKYNNRIAPPIPIRTTTNSDD